MEGLRLRQEDARLRQENAELQRQYRHALLRAIGSNNSDPKQREAWASDFVDAEDEAAGLANASGGDEGKGHKRHYSHHSELVTTLITIGIVVLFILVMLGLEVRSFLIDRPEDLDGDGDVDINDFFMHLMRKFPCYYLEPASQRRLLVFTLQFGAGFAFLWWMGMIQPVLSTLVVYLYFIVLAIWSLKLFGEEGSSGIMSAFSGLEKVGKTVEGYFDKGYDEFNQAVADCRRGCDDGMQQLKVCC